MASTYLSIDLVYQPIGGEAGEVTLTFVQGHYITEQKPGEMAAAASEACFAALHNLPPIVCGRRKLTEISIGSATSLSL